jgi:hypothetical protein
MVEITCDSCGKRKPDAGKSLKEKWVLGWDLQVENRSGVQRSIRFLDKWDDRRVTELGGIHLCSQTCKDAYLHGQRRVA